MNVLMKTGITAVIMPSALTLLEVMTVPVLSAIQGMVSCVMVGDT